MSNEQTTALTADAILDELVALSDPGHSEYLSFSLGDREAEFVQDLLAWRQREFTEGISGAVTERMEDWLRAIHKSVLQQITAANQHADGKTYTPAVATPAQMAQLAEGRAR